MTESLTYTVPQAAVILGISSWSAYEAIKRGELPARKVGRRIVVPKIQLEQWLADYPDRSNGRSNPPAA